MELREMANNYLLNVKAIFSEGTFECYKSHLDYTLKYFKKINIINLDDLKNIELTKFIINQKNNNVSNSTINKRVGALKRMIEFSKLENNLSFQRLKEKKVNFNYLTNKEIKILFNYIDNCDFLASSSVLIVHLLLDTGCRLSELLKIKIKNINFSDNCILLEDTKTDCNRYVRFTEYTKSLLLSFIKTNKGKLFKVSRSGVESVFVRIRKKLGFKNFSPHVLRHTHATILARNNASIFYIQDDLGHKSSKTTERYVHLTFDDNQKIYKSCFNY